MNVPPSDQTPSTPFGQSYSNAEFEEADRHLAETKPWVRFVAVLGFVMCVSSVAFFLLGALSGGMQAALVSGFSLLFSAFFYLIPSILLWNYGSRIGEHTHERGSATFSDALAAQKSYWRYLGIVVVTIIALYVVVIAGFVAFGLSSTMR